MRRKRWAPDLTIVGLSAIIIGAVCLLFNRQLIRGSNVGLLIFGSVLVLVAVVLWLYPSGSEGPVVPIRSEPAPVSPEAPAAHHHGSSRLMSAVGRPLRDGTLTVLGPDGHRIASARSGNWGEFSFPSLADGRYIVVGQAPPYEPNAGVMDMRSGQGVMDIVLRGTTVIQGQARTIDTGEAIAGAKVELRSPTGDLFAVQLTAEDGRFRFADVPEGEWEVVSWTPAHESQETVVSVVCREPLDLELHFRPLGSICGRLLLGATPVPSARVLLRHTDGAPVAATRTDPAGNYSFEAVRGDTYLLVAATLTPTARTVTVVPGKTADRDLILKSGN